MIISVQCIYITFLIFVINLCNCYKILVVFPNDGPSHHKFFASLIEELTVRNHNVTTISHFPFKNHMNLKQITLESSIGTSLLTRNIDKLRASWLFVFKDIYVTYETSQLLKEKAKSYCKSIINNEELEDLVRSKTEFDLVIIEQFATDCGLAFAYKLNTPVVGMAAHVLMPWTSERLGASIHPAFVPNRFIATGSKPGLWTRIKSFIINTSISLYYHHFIQKAEDEIVKEKYPDVPDLESLGKNMSLIMINQYFPLTGSRLQAANIIEIGGMHINKIPKIVDEELKSFLDTAKQGVVYISFGTVASNFPEHILSEIIEMIEFYRDIKFIWKIDDIKNWKPTENVLIRKWLPQTSVLCHHNVIAFVSHSGMLGSTEAMYCGVPVISVPLFGDQFANAASAQESGLAVVLDFETITSTKLKEALQKVSSQMYQVRAKELSKIWRDRPLSPMDTAIFWLEYVIKHKNVNLKPANVDLPFYQYLMLDIILVFGSFVMIIVYVIYKVFKIIKSPIKFNNKTVKVTKSQ